MTPHHPWDEARALTLIGERQHLPGALLPMLHALQEEFGYVPNDAFSLLADALNISRAEVVGVVRFYHDFREAPAGRHVLKVCRAEACQAAGCDALVTHLETTLGIEIGETTPDGALTVEPIYCLGDCALSPAVMLDGHTIGRVTPETADTLIATLTTAHPEALASTATLAERSPPFQGRVSATAVRIFVPADSAAVSVGANDVAAAIQREIDARGLNATIVRNGTRGALYLEPLVEVEVPAESRTQSARENPLPEIGEGAGGGVRLAYGPVTAADVPSLFDAGFLSGGAHPLTLGPTDQISFLKQQERLTFARCGVIDPLSIAEYKAHGGNDGLRRALGMPPEAIVEEVVTSGLRGRGGAGFPTGIKWRTVLQQPEGQKYIVCNADEGDSGTYADRMIMEGDPFSLIEGMTIAGLAVGADTGFIYLRSEYPDAFRVMQQAVALARGAGYLGSSVLGSGKSFDIDVRLGAGAYICGEETSLLESLEGKRGIIRPKPPLPAIHGLFGKPTVINNVLSLATVPVIFEKGAAYYAGFGMGRSRGTLPIQLAGNIKRGGLVEKAFGLTLRQAIEDFGGGTGSGRPLRAVQVGGPLGAYFPESLLDTPLDYEAFAEKRGLVGHGGVVVFDDTVDLAKQARFAMEFCAIESCGKCTPCRIGSTRGVEVIDRIINDEGRLENIELLDDLCNLMLDASLCALGGLTPYPVQSAMQHFPEDFARPAPTATAAQEARS